MYNDGKHHFDLNEYSILQLLYAGTLPAYKSFRMEYSFRWKWNYSHPSRLPEYCNTWKCFTYSFEAEKEGDFLLLLKKNIDAEVWK